MSNAFDKWTAAPAPAEAPKKEIRKAEFRLIESQENETQLQIGIATEASPDHPQRNEDSYYVSEERGIDFVADGVGGGLAGNLASAKAAQELTLERLATRDIMTRLVMEAGREEPMVSKEDVENALRQTMENMQEAVTKLQTDPGIVVMAVKRAEAKYKRKFDPALASDRYIVLDIARSMSCTASLSKIWRDQEGKDFNTIAHIGDSRIYRLRQGRLERMTPDHSVFQTIIDLRLLDKNGEAIVNDQDITRKITRKEIEKHASKYPELAAVADMMRSRNQDDLQLVKIADFVLQTIGSPTSNKKYYHADLKPFIRTDELEDGDVELKCSDGLSDVLTDDEIQAVLIRHIDEPMKAAQELEQLAAARSQTGHVRAKPDDITIIVRKFKKKKEEPVA